MGKCCWLWKKGEETFNTVDCRTMEGYLVIMYSEIIVKVVCYY